MRVFKRLQPASLLSKAGWAAARVQAGYTVAIWTFTFHEILGSVYRHSSISAVSISTIFNLLWFIILSYFPPL